MVNFGASQRTSSVSPTGAGRYFACAVLAGIPLGGCARAKTERFQITASPVLVTASTFTAHEDVVAKHGEPRLIILNEPGKPEIRDFIFPQDYGIQEGHTYTFLIERKTLRDGGVSIEFLKISEGGRTIYP